MKCFNSLVFSVLFLFVFCFSAGAQLDMSVGAVTESEISLKECPFDREADAVIIYHKAESNYNEEHNLITDHKVKLKILKEKGIEQGNIRIRYYSGDDFEYVSRIKATIMTFNDNGQAIRLDLEPRNIYKKALNKYRSEISFAMPNVKVGSIIEYSYTSTMKHYGGLDHWYFQEELPVMLSSYRLYIIPNVEFAYTVYKKPEYSIDIKNDPNNGSASYEMKNIPGLRDEVYMGSENDYLQRVNFQLAGYHRNGSKFKYATTWKELAQQLLMERYLGAQLNKSLPGAAKELWETAPSPVEKMNIIHNYVRSSMNWDFVYSKFSENVKDAWEKKRGNTGDINLILINLLQSAGLEAYPLLVSERDHGKIDTAYPYQDQFNKTVAYVEIDGKQYVLDATETRTPSRLIPYDLLNTIGFLVDRKKYKLIHLDNSKAKDISVISIKGDIDKSGIMKASAGVVNYDYAKVDKRVDYLSNKAKYQEDFLKPHGNLKPDSFHVEGTELDSLPMKHELSFRAELNQSGGYYLLPFNFFSGFTTNPFISANRFSDINFGSMRTCILNASYTIPGNMMVESLPKNMKLVTPENSMVVYRQLSKHDNTIDVNIKIEISGSQYEADMYEMVKDFYKRMVDALNEPILLKAK